MKTIYLNLTFLLVLISSNISAQTIENHALGRSAFKDAKAMFEKPDDNFNEILKAYGFENDADIDALNKKYNSKIPNFKSKDSSNVSLVSVQSGEKPLIFSNPTQGIEALGSFIAVRFKQEINIAFLEKFKKDLDTLPYLGEIFPVSKKVLKYSDPYNYPVFMETLRQAFEEDMKNIFFNIPIALNDKRIYSPYAKLISLVINIKDLNNLVVNINNIANSLPDTTKFEIKKTLYILAFTVNSLYKKGTNAELFLKSLDIKLLGDRIDLRNNYIALLLTQNEKFLLDVNPDADKIMNLINGLIPDYTAIATQINKLGSEVAQNKLTIKLGTETIDVISSNIRDGITKFHESEIDTSFNPEKSLEIIGYCQNVSGIVNLIDEKKYGLAAINLIDFLKKCAAGQLASEQESKLLRYTSFITNVLSATTTDDMLQALESSANPVGSYRVKRNSTFDISLNSFAGGFGGTNKNATSFLYGFTAPVGLYFGWGKGQDNKIENEANGKSFGLFISIVDVGAVTAFRLKDSKTELANVSWSNVFSPGAYLTYGFGKCPISLNIGGQMGPELNSIDNTGKPAFITKEFYWRAALVIDIPIFDFYIRQKAYKL